MVEENYLLFQASLQPKLTAFNCTVHVWNTFLYIFQNQRQKHGINSVTHFNLHIYSQRLYLSLIFFLNIILWAKPFIENNLHSIYSLRQQLFQELEFKLKSVYISLKVNVLHTYVGHCVIFIVCGIFIVWQRACWMSLLKDKHFVCCCIHMI